MSPNSTTHQPYQHLKQHHAGSDTGIRTKSPYTCTDTLHLSLSGNVQRTSMAKRLKSIMEAYLKTFLRKPSCLCIHKVGLPSTVIAQSTLGQVRGCSSYFTSLQDKIWNLVGVASESDFVGISLQGSTYHQQQPCTHTTSSCTWNFCTPLHPEQCLCLQSPSWFEKLKV